MNATTFVDLSALPLPPHVTHVSIIVEPDDMANADPERHHACGDPDCGLLKTFGDEWQYVGVRAVAEVVVGNVIQHIDSGGVWGIASNSDEAHLRAEARWQFDELRGVLAALRIQLDTPFEQAEWVER